MERFADTVRRATLRVERGWAAREPCYFQQGGGNLCCQRGELKKDPVGALIYATRQTTQGQCRCKRSQDMCAVFAALWPQPERPAGEPNKGQPVDWQLLE